MIPDGTVTGPEEAADIVFYEVEAPDGFLHRLEERVFAHGNWQRFWQAVATLLTESHGTLDVWASYDVSRMITAVQVRGDHLAGHAHDTLDEFEVHILAAYAFIDELFSAP